MLSYFLSLGCLSLLCHGTLRTQDGQTVTVCRAPVLHLPLSISEDQGSFDQVCRSCRRRLRVRILAVPVLPWCQGKATSPSSLVRHQREGTLLPRAVLAGRMFFPTWGTQNHYPRYPRIIQCADTLVMLLLHISNAFVWHFIIFRHLWVQPCEPDSITVIVQMRHWKLLRSLLLTPSLLPSPPPSFPLFFLKFRSQKDGVRIWL